MSVQVPSSTTDPYSPEPSSSAPVLVRLQRANGSSLLLHETSRILSDHHAILQHNAVSYTYRSTNGKGERIYVESPTIDLDGKIAIFFPVAQLRALTKAKIEADLSKQADKASGMHQLSLASHAKLGYVMRIRALLLSAIEAVAHEVA